MALGRGSVMKCISVMLCLMVCLKTSFATNFTVGDASGWRFGVSSWPDGKSFKAGDVLEFKYNRIFHDVIVVDKKGYESCTVPEGAPKFKTGDDLITLKKGDNYFLCGFPFHCFFGMKIAITAA
ncbi:plantacyanin [Hibiscus trionum]|uniref:Basic blue protein n=1 Tax=Hibiscus trionum TaxID=183268 RepID=A0A9W7LPA8_HIBTR|nr:plantacyanin [Hibiscus trionum]GMI70535.1 plantacyanin [Hibiscus trionum]